MSTEKLPPLRFSATTVDTITLYQEGRTPRLYPLPGEEGVVAIVPDKPLKPGISHWQIDPEDPGRIIFADLRGTLKTTATLYLLPRDKAETVK